MAASDKDRSRTVLPRWRSSSLAISVESIVAPNALISSDADLSISTAFDRASADYKTNPFPAELIEYAVAAQLTLKSDDQELTRLQSLLRTTRPNAGAVYGTKIERLLQSDDEGSEVLPVRSIRRLLRANPRNAILWSDLALHFTVLGKVKDATKAIATAVAIEHENPLIVRAATRYFIHVDDSDRALEVLFRSGKVYSDPWITAAYLACIVATERTPVNMRAIQNLQVKSFGQRGGSELSAAILSFYSLNQEASKVNKYFRDSMVMSTENALAQLLWTVGRSNMMNTGVMLPQGVIEDIGSNNYANEARARLYTSKQEYDLAVTEGLSWRKDQPFSIRPTTYVSYLLTTVLGRHAEAEKILKEAYITAEHDVIILNNLAYSLAKQDKLDEAHVVVKRMTLLATTKSDQMYVRALQGLIEYKRNNVTRARELYADAYGIAFQLKERDTMLNTLINQYEHEKVLPEGGLEGLDVQIQRMVASSSNNELKFFFERVSKPLTGTE